MKVSLPLCACFAAICTQLAGCGDQAEGSRQATVDASRAANDHDTAGSGGSSEASPSDLGGAALVAAAGAAETEDAEATEHASHFDCPDPCAQQTSCGQICITMKGAGSSCQLAPTANDLTRLPRTVQFDCSQLSRGPNGYDLDAQGHFALMGETCQALNKDGPHRVVLILACPPS